MPGNRFTSKLLAMSTLTIVLVVLSLPTATAFLSHQQQPRVCRPFRQTPNQHRCPQPTSPSQNSFISSLSLAETQNSGDDNISWNDAIVRNTKAACPSGKSLLWSIQLDNTDALSLGYTTPGQFLQLRWKESTDPLFLAMYSPPPTSDDDDDQKKTLHFLVKTTPNIPWLTDIHEGATVQVSNIMGDGFAAAAKAFNNASEGDDADADDAIDYLLLVAAGSGIAPLMACLRTREWMDKVTYKTAYYGEWTFDDICFQEELATEEAGINLVPCFSKQERDFTKGFWSGHVQMVMWQRGIVNPDKTLALVCGSAEMMDDVRQLLTRAGVKPERIVTNM